jgi:multiple antibiotic resistance protein
MSLDGDVMGQLEVGVNFFVALFALIDPVGNVPMFAAATQGAPSRARARIALYISLFAAAFLVFFYFSGTAILRFFGISMPAFRIAGGILLLLLGLDMSRESDAMGQEGLLEKDEVDRLDTGAYAKKHFERLIVPFGMPLLIGPGAISTVIIYASEADDLLSRAVGVGAILATSITILIAFLLSGVLTRLLGKTGMVIVIRVLGLVLCAMAVQFILVGLSGATVGLVRGSAAHPWQTP